MFRRYNALGSTRISHPRETALLACGDNLMPLSWHMPISKSPFRYGVAISKENHTHQLLQEFKSFTLNFLPFSYYQEVDSLGRIHGDSVNKHAMVDFDIFDEDSFGNPLLSASHVIYACRVVDVLSYGDHTLFVADVVHIYEKEEVRESPMLFLGRGSYATMANRRQAKVFDKEKKKEIMV
jgi:flavin reductase (DIM6/NTAB) family NADH-FMN oxidoreductase RutF